MRILTFLVDLFGGAPRIVEASQLPALEKKVDRLLLSSADAMQKLTDAREAADRSWTRYERDRDRVVSATEAAEKTIRTLQEALDAAREELTTAREITIPGLVASHRTLINRWEAEAAVFAAKRDFAVPPREE